MSYYLNPRFPRIQGTLFAYVPTWELQASTNYAQTKFQAGDAFIFGPETRGLSAKFLNSLEEENSMKRGDKTTFLLKLNK